MLKSPGFMVNFLTEAAVTAAIDGTKVTMRAWPRAGWSRVQHSGVSVPGGALTCLGRWMLLNFCIVAC